jgi:Mn-dependent DtxR family transcriptional regulator
LKSSKLENYLAILQTLSATHHPLKIAEIEKATTIEQPDLEEALSFMLKQNAVEKKRYGSSSAFFVAPLGAKLLQYFSSHNI